MGEEPRIWTRAQALQALGRDRLTSLVKSGAVRRIVPGLYAESKALAQWDRELATLYAWAGAGAIVSFTCAAHLHGLDLPGRVEITLTLPRSRRLESDRFSIRRCDLPIEHVRLVRRFRCTSLSWTVLDLAAEIADPLDLAILVESAWRQKPRTFRESLATALDQHGSGRTGTTRLASVLAECNARELPFRSAKEVECWHFLKSRAHLIPLPKPLHQVQDELGRMEIDFAWPEQRLALELNGRAWHWNQVEQDSERTCRLVALDWRVAPVTARAFDHNREAFFARLQRSLERHRALFLPTGPKVSAPALATH